MTGSRRSAADLQRERVLRALLSHPRGITPIDFGPPDVIDGGPPIARVAARILDLRTLGCQIKTERLPNRVALYKLVSAPRDLTDQVTGARRQPSPPSPEPQPAPQSLAPAGVGAAPPRCALFDFDEEAA